MPLNSRLDRYLFRLTIVPLLGVFVLAASLLILDQMLRLFRFVTTEGGPVGVVFQMLGTLLPDYASLAIPLGLLLGTLFAFRQLALSSELDVMRAVGLSYSRLLRVPYAITLVLMAINAALVYLEHHLRRLVEVHAEEPLEDHDDEFHRRIIVVEHQHPVLARLLRLGAGFGRDADLGIFGRALVRVIVAHAALRG